VVDVGLGEWLHGGPTTTAAAAACASEAALRRHGLAATAEDAEALMGAARRYADQAVEAGGGTVAVTQVCNVSCRGRYVQHSRDGLVGCIVYCVLAVEIEFSP
jgi:hypothetical protein